MAAGTVVGLFMVAGAIASIYYGKGSERGSPRRRQSNMMFWSFMGGAFAAGTPLMAGGTGGSGAGATGAGAGGTAAGTAATTSAEVGTAAATGTAGAGSAAAGSSGLTATSPAFASGTNAGIGNVGSQAAAAGGGAAPTGLAMTGAQTAAMEITVTAPAFASGTYAGIGAVGSQAAAAGGVTAGGVGANFVRGDAPQETWWQRWQNEQQPQEKGKASDWLDDLGTPRQERQQDETIEQPPAPDVDYYAIAAENERRRRQEESIGQQDTIPEGRHGERRWGDWWGG